jgi:hypothetical protein
VSSVSDVEGAYTGATAAELMAFYNAAAQAIVGAGFVAGLYCGPQNKMSGADLYSLSAVSRYWQSGSEDLNPPYPRGYSLIQLYPPSQPGGGTAIDYDTTQTDFRGGTWTMMAG